MNNNTYTPQFRIYKEGTTTEGSILVATASDDFYLTPQLIDKYSELGYTIISLEGNSIIAEPKTYFIGKFYILCSQFIGLYKIGGNQKLAELLNTSNFTIYSKVGQQWVYANNAFCNLPVSTIKAYCSYIESAINVKTHNSLIP